MKKLGLISLLFSLMFWGSVSTARADIVQWTLHDVMLTGTFGTATVTGTFEFPGLASDVTVNEQTNPTLYTYTFTGQVNGAGYSNQSSQQPPTLRLLAGCDPIGGPVPPAPSRSASTSSPP